MSTSDDSRFGDLARMFLDLVLDEVRDGSLRAVREDLEEPTGGENHLLRREWFRSLGEDDREKVMEVARAAVDQALFDLMVLLDQSSPGAYMDDPPAHEYSEFVLSAEFYDGLESWRAAHESRNRVNHFRDNEGLHDKFMRAVMEAEEEGSDE